MSGGGSVMSGGAQEIAVPNAARCPGCRYDLRRLREPRCPECGRAFDPADIETMHIATWDGLLARRFLKPAGFVFYLWPVVAAALLWLAWVWLAGIIYESTPSPAAPRLPGFPGDAYRYLVLWSVALFLWLALLIAWALRAAVRRHVVKTFALPHDYLHRDRRARRFTCACFIAAVLLMPPHTDRCTHGEYWEMWLTVGVERDVAGGFCETHARACIPLGGGWHLYWRR